MAGQGRGWLTAEYGMLPASTGDRKQRDVSKGRPDGRTVEIQRLIGRSLRGVVDFKALGERTVYIDCDVLQADGGTRCASITGGYVALELACRRLVDEGKLKQLPLTGTVAAVSCGVVDGEALLDLDYPEDSSAEVDANVVMTGEGGLVEVQATAERTPLSRAHLDELLALAADGHREPARRPGGGGRPLGAGTMAVVLATRNAHKLREFRRLLPDAALEPLPDEVELPPETGATFEENALIKARAASAATGAPAIADDSGIEAEALGGRPGVRSARYAGEDATDAENLDKLRAEVAGRLRPALRLRGRLRRARRGAAHRRGHAARAAWPRHPRGEGGFGYDPVFVPADGDGERTMAELSDAEKDRISHRGRAVREAAAWLPTLTHGPGSRSRAAALSIASNSALILLKIVAGAVTGSVAIITEAIHSGIDLIASLVAYFSVRQAETPADSQHRYGHEKFENVAAGIEGMLILVGSGVIVYTAVDHLVEGTEIESIGFGIAVVAFATVVNLIVSQYLYRRAAATDSAALAGDAAHLRTDAMTSLGVLVGLALVSITDQAWIDPVVALCIAVAIVYTGLKVVAGSWRVLVDEALPDDETAAIRDAIESFAGRGVGGYHELRTRRAGPRRYVDVHVQFRSGTTLEDAHAIAHALQDTIRGRLRGADVLIHLEPEDRVRPGEEIGAGGGAGTAH